MKSRTLAFILASCSLGPGSLGCQSKSHLPPQTPAEMPSSLTAQRTPAALPVVEELGTSDVTSRHNFVASRSKDQLGAVVVEGGQVDDARQVAAAMLPSFHDCKMRWSPNTSGEVQVKAKIGPVGEVRIAKPEGDALPPMLIACVTANVAGAKFAAPTGNDPTVVIPIRFVE
jgi:hypothetical protein